MKIRVLKVHAAEAIDMHALTVSVPDTAAANDCSRPEQRS
jgi:hypothetical protein